jgi:hypothetical protein
LVRFLDDCDFITAGTTLTGEPSPKRNGKDRAAEPKKIIAAEFTYENEDGSPAFVVERIEYQNPDGSFVLTKEGKHKKAFRQGRLDPDKFGGWIWNVDGVPPVVYRLPAVIEAIAQGHSIVIVEGEAKADQLRSWNVPATCCAIGAGKWRPEHSAFLRGADIVILPDNDEVGRKHADLVAASLQNIAASVRILALPDLPDKGDIIDWAAMGGTVEKLHALIERAAEPSRPRNAKMKDGAPPIVKTRTLLQTLASAMREMMSNLRHHADGYSAISSPADSCLTSSHPEAPARAPHGSHNTYRS